MNPLIALSIALLAAVHAAPQSSGTTPVPILSENSNLQPDGSFQFAFQSGDGVQVQNQGTLKEIEVQKADGSGTVKEQVIVQSGSYSYQAPDGQQITVTYTADENGFHPQGAHLPVANVNGQ